MSQAVIADPADFARRGASLEGEVDVASLQRLVDAASGPAGSRKVRYRLEGSRRGDGLYIDLAAETVLGLTCQRCLEAMDYALEARTLLLLVPEGKPLPDDELEDDSCDAVHASRNFDVLAAVEDELLLAMPLAPMHEDCVPPHADAAGNKDSPFAALARLRQPK